MTREYISRLLAIYPMADIPELLDALEEEKSRLIKASAVYGGNRYTIDEGGTSICGMWNDLQRYAAGIETDLNERLEVFDDSAEVASWFADAANEEGPDEELMNWAASRVLALYGLLALAAKAQVEEAHDDRDDEECRA